MSHELDLSGPLPTGRVVVEASAGTGKTYSLTALIVRHVAERHIVASDLLVVTFTRAAAAELRDRTRQMLVDAAAVLRHGEVPTKFPWMQVLLETDDDERAQRRHWLDQAVSGFDDATITTIHGFCQQALRQLGLRAGTRLGSELVENTAELVDEVCRDMLVTALVDDPHALSWRAGGPKTPLVPPAKVLDLLSTTVTMLLGNPGASAAPDPVVVTPAKGDTSERLVRWVDLVHAATAEVRRRREARQELGYDDLVTRLRDAVMHPGGGPSVVAALSARYRLVLVDEFQDTDPVQWQIFDTAFRGDLVVVGDPKQAIYRFRGADVHAYLAATRGASTLQLMTNYRSDGDLVEAVGSLVTGVALGHERIVAAPLRPAPTAAARALTPGSPVELRWLRRDESLLTAKGAVSTPLMRRAVLSDLVGVAIDLLDHHRLETGEGERSLDPGDLAVLVPTHTLAEAVVEALDRAGIPAVRTRTGSVLETSTLGEWRLLLAALERPSHAPTVRAAGLGWFLAERIGRLDPFSEESTDVVAALQQRCARWADELSTRPFAAWYDSVRAESGLIERLLGWPGGERELTDLDHVAELLAADLGGRGVSAASVRRRLEQMATDVAAGDSDGQMRRIDSDARAVQVTTLHSSKGLEYPVVLLPFSWHKMHNKGPLVYDDEGHGRVVDVATGQGWSGPAPVGSSAPADTEKRRQHLAAVDRRGDLLRLLYVALTRAKHRTVVWWAPTTGSESSALAAVLFDRDSAGAPLNSLPDLGVGPRGGLTPTLPKFKVDDGNTARRLADLATASAGHIGVAECPPESTPAPWSGADGGGPSATLTVADPAGRALADPAWRRWSFTSLTRTRDAAGGDVVDLVPPAPAIGGGIDEPEATDTEAGVTEAGLTEAGVTEAGVTNGATPDSAVAGPGVPNALLAGLPAGTAFGTFVHAVLEAIDPTSPVLESALANAVSRQWRRDRLDVDQALLVDGLAAAVRTPLGPIADDARLADLPPADRLAELTFDLPLVDTRRAFAARSVGDVLVATLSVDDPLRPYALSLAAGRFDVDLAGYLQGSIDAVLRVPASEGGHRYLVVDYKSNRLHVPGSPNPLAAYHPDLLVAAMEHHDYPLQALLYSVALHRYLRWRLPGYRPERHLGGIAYLFVRGMAGPATPRHVGCPAGVFAWRPPAATIEGLDRLLSTGVAA